MMMMMMMMRGKLMAMVCIVAVGMLSVPTLMNGVNAMEICVGDQALCDLFENGIFAAPWNIPFSYSFPAINATVGDSLSFTYTPSHNVRLMKGFAEYVDCDFDGDLNEREIPGAGELEFLNYGIRSLKIELVEVI